MFVSMKWKALLILLIILVSLIPAYLFNKYLQKLIKPRESGLRFLFYMLSAFALVFIYTFLVVFAIKRLFPQA
jgi:hypothetical protein